MVGKGGGLTVGKVTGSVRGRESVREGLNPPKTVLRDRNTTTV
jgi:hypothetical protein